MRLYPSTKELVARRAHTPRLAPMSREGSVLMERDRQRFPSHNMRGEGARGPVDPKTVTEPQFHDRVKKPYPSRIDIFDNEEITTLSTR